MEEHSRDSRFGDFPRIRIFSEALSGRLEARWLPLNSSWRLQNSSQRNAAPDGPALVFGVILATSEVRIALLLDVYSVTFSRDVD